MYRWTKVNDLYSMEAFVSHLSFDPENNDPESTRGAETKHGT